MSEDLRIKKLRGSGGFVIAQVTDEQQRKGNLGGPDLFLAPIGRLDFLQRGGNIFVLRVVLPLRNIENLRNQMN